MISLSRAILYVFLSVVCVWGSVFVYIWQNKKHLVERVHDTSYCIQRILQRRITKDAVTCSQLAEMLNLSVDKPQHIDLFNEKEAEKKLLGYGIFDQVRVEKVLPNALFISYSIKEAVAYLGGYENIALDTHKRPFLLRPFLSEKRLPILYSDLDVSSGNWDHLQPTKSLDLAFAIKTFLEKQTQYQIKQIDTTNVFKENVYRGEFVVILETFLNKKALQIILRCAAATYEKQLNRFFSMESLFFSLLEGASAKSLIVNLVDDAVVLFKLK